MAQATLAHNVRKWQASPQNSSPTGDHQYGSSFRIGWYTPDSWPNAGQHQTGSPPSRLPGMQLTDLCSDAVLQEEVALSTSIPQDHERIFKYVKDSFQIDYKVFRGIDPAELQTMIEFHKKRYCSAVAALLQTVGKIEDGSSTLLFSHEEDPQRSQGLASASLASWPVGARPPASKKVAMVCGRRDGGEYSLIVAEGIQVKHIDEAKLTGHSLLLFVPLVVDVACGAPIFSLAMLGVGSAVGSGATYAGLRWKAHGELAEHRDGSGPTAVAAYIIHMLQEQGLIQVSDGVVTIR